MDYNKYNKDYIIFNSFINLLISLNTLPIAPKPKYLDL